MFDGAFVYNEEHGGQRVTLSEAYNSSEHQFLISKRGFQKLSPGIIGRMKRFFFLKSPSKSVCA